MRMPPNHDDDETLGLSLLASMRGGMRMPPNLFMAGLCTVLILLQ